MEKSNNVKLKKMEKAKIEEYIQTAKKEDYYPGDLDKVVEHLLKCKSEKKNVYVEFRGKKLYSMVGDIDAWYLTVTGRTKAQNDELLRAQEEKDILEELSAYDKMEENISEGKLVVDINKEQWEEFVLKRTEGFGHGGGIANAIQVMKKISSGDMEGAYAVVEKMEIRDLWIVLDIVKKFHSKGRNFENYVDLQNNHYL